MAEEYYEFDQIKSGNRVVYNSNIIQFKDNFILYFKNYQEALGNKPKIKYEYFKQPETEEMKNSLEDLQDYDFIVQYKIRNFRISSADLKNMGQPVQPFMVNHDSEDGTETYRFFKTYELAFDVYGEDYDNTYRILNDILDFSYILNSILKDNTFYHLNPIDGYLLNLLMSGGNTVYRLNAALKVILENNIVDYEGIIRNIDINIDKDYSS